MPKREPPLLPRPVVTVIAVVVLAAWLMTAVAAVLNPAGAGPLITVSGILAMVIGGGYGYGGVRRALLPRDTKETEDERP